MNDEKEKKSDVSQVTLILLTALSLLAFFADGAALIMLSMEIRATSAAFVVYGMAVLFTVSALLIFVFRKEKIKNYLSEKITKIKIIKYLKKFSVFEKSITDYGYRTLMTSAFMLFFNFAYVNYLVWMAVSYRSSYFAAMAGYYAWLAITRTAIVASQFLLEKHGKFNERNGFIISLVAGICFIIAAGGSIAPSLQMISGTYPQGGKIFDIVINALFCLIKTFSAVLQCLRATAFRHPVTIALRNLSLIAAMMSMLTLQIPIIIVFGGGSTLWEMVASYGTVIFAATSVIGAVTIIKAVIGLNNSARESFSVNSDDKFSEK